MLKNILKITAFASVLLINGIFADGEPDDIVEKLIERFPVQFQPKARRVYARLDAQEKTAVINRLQYRSDTQLTELANAFDNPEDTEEDRIAMAKDLIRTFRQAPNISRDEIVGRIKRGEFRQRRRMMKQQGQPIRQQHAKPPIKSNQPR